MIPRLFIQLIFISFVFGVEPPDHGLRFNGDGYVRIEDSESLTLDRDFTIEFWAKYDTTLQYAHLLNKHQPGKNDDGSWVVKIQNDDTPDQTIAFGWPYSPNEISFIISDIYQSRKWNHYALCYNDSLGEITLWINGDLHGKVSRNIVINDTDWPLYIGSEVLYNYYEGKLAEVRLSSIVRYSSTFRPPNQFAPDIYTLAYWPLNQGRGEIIKDKSDYGNHGTAFHLKWVRPIISWSKIGLILLVFILIGWFFISKKKKEIINSDPIDKSIIPLKGQKNTICLFGEFQVWDKEGKNITYLFTPILKELFLMILLYTYRNGGGIKTDKLTTILWPDLDMDHSKNTRGTAINRLRKVLQKMDGLSIEHKNHLWKMHYTKKVICDYIDYEQYVRESDAIDSVELLVKIYNQGPFLENTSHEWLDGIQAGIEIKAVSLYEKKIQNSSVNDCELQLLLSNGLLLWEPYNEFAMDTKIAALKGLGKTGLAKKAEEKLNTIQNS